MGCEPNDAGRGGEPGGDRPPDAPVAPGHDDRADLPHYLVGGGTPALLTALAGEFEADPRVRLVRIVGPAATPDLLVAAMPAAAAREYQARYRGLATIEEDSPLGL